jgi:hypothetical protein
MAAVRNGPSSEARGMCHNARCFISAEASVTSSPRGTHCRKLLQLPKVMRDTVCRELPDVVPIAAPDAIGFACLSGGKESIVSEHVWIIHSMRLVALGRGGGGNADEGDIWGLADFIGGRL